MVRNQEIIPVDAVLINGEGNIDNSFITGESASIPVSYTHLDVYKRQLLIFVTKFNNSHSD